VSRRRTEFLDQWLWLIVVVCLAGTFWLVRPAWWFGGVLVAIPTTAMIQWIRHLRDGTFRRKRNAMLSMNEAVSSTCLDCGYDLSGLATDAACPEFGFAARRPREVLLAPHGRPEPPAAQHG